MIKALIRDRSGTAAAEYAMILAIVGAAIVVAAIALATAAAGAMTGIASTISSYTTTLND